MAAQERVPPNIIQSIVGHIDPEVTRMYMDHFTDDQKRLATAGLPDYLGIAARSGQPALLSAETADTRLGRIAAILRDKSDLTPREREVLAIATD